MHRTAAALLAALALNFALAATAPAADWPQWLGPNRDSVWPETGVLDAFPAGGPKVRWRVPVGVGYSGPAVVGDRVFVTDFISAGYKAQDHGEGGPADFKRATLAGVERVRCLSADTGRLVWEHEYDCRYEVSYPGGPRCAPTVHDGKVYTLGAMGRLLCLDAATGAVVWSKDLPRDYGVKVPLFGFAGHPLVDGHKLVCTVGGDGTTAAAFDKDTGKELWRALSSREVGYSSPVVVRAGGSRQVVVWHGEGLAGLDPETGTPLWSVPLPAWQGVVTMVPRQDGDHLFAGTVFGTAVTLRLGAEGAASQVWRGKRAMKDGLFPAVMTPFAEGGVLYGADQSGQFRAVRTATGERLWESWLPVTGKEESGAVYNGTAYVVKNGDRFVLFAETGELILARLSPAGYQEVSRAKVIEPTGTATGRRVAWSHPAFANRCAYVRNDKELVCVDLAK